MTDLGSPRTLPSWACLLFGCAGALVGLLPWLLTGGRLPVQNLWEDGTPPDALPRVLLPFSQYHVTDLVGLLLTGSVAAAIAVRAAGPRVPRRGATLAFVGLAVVQVVAVVQTAWAVQTGLPDRRLAQLYLAALVLGSLISVVAGALVYGLVARAPRGGALLGLGLAVVPLASWLSVLVVPDVTSAGPTALALLGVVRWVPAVLLGGAVAWAGTDTAGRVLAALAGLFCLWVGPAAVTALANALGSRVYLRHPEELVSYAVAVFGAALTQPALVLPNLGLAVAVAVVGLVGRRVLGRRRSERGSQDG